MAIHKPVLLKEVLSIFNPQPGEKYVDATINGGGHSAAILERISPCGTLLGIDWDCELIKAAKFQIPNPKSQNNKIVLTCNNYANLKSIIREHNLDTASGILFDLGFSSYHPEASRRGFSFLKNENLDMRYNTFHALNAAKIVNNWSEKAIEDILRRLGEERYSRKIAGAIVRERSRKKISTTNELVKIISECVPGTYLRSRIHPATKTFQALRIAVNNELDNLAKALGDSLEILNSGGKIVVISFHSLEDRIVKNFFKENAKSGYLRIITPKPVRPSREEIVLNPRSRSARLRAAEKIL